MLWGKTSALQTRRRKGAVFLYFVAFLKGMQVSDLSAPGFSFAFAVAPDTGFHLNIPVGNVMVSTEY